MNIYPLILYYDKVYQQKSFYVIIAYAFNLSDLTYTWKQQHWIAGNYSDKQVKISLVSVMN
jgi:hypothetical protein